LFKLVPEKDVVQKACNALACDVRKLFLWAMCAQTECAEHHLQPLQHSVIDVDLKKYFASKGDSVGARTIPAYVRDYAVRETEGLPLPKQRIVTDKRDYRHRPCSRRAYA